MAISVTGHDAVVVGAGVNGLTAAARLAATGRSVLVVERASTVGGNGRTSELLVDGVRHDLGAAVVPFAAASPAFGRLGLSLDLVHSPVALAHPLDGGDAAVLHRDVDLTAAGLGRDASRYRRLVSWPVEHFDELITDVMAPQLKVPRHPLLMARFGALAALPATLASAPLRTESARALFVGIASHATVPADRPVTGGVGYALLLAAHAVGWPVAVGGTQAVADALAAFVRERGGTIELGTEVRSLDELPRAPITLLDISPRQFARLAPGAAPAYRAWRYGPGACKVDYVLDGPMPWTAPACRESATVHVGGTAAEMVAAEREVAAGRHAERPFVLVAQPDVADPTRRHGELRPLWTYCHVPHGSDVDASPAIERQLDRFAPGWRDRVVAKRVLTARDSEATNPNLVGGDIAAGLMSMRQVLLGPRRRRTAVSPYRTDRPGVYLCSSSCPPGPGIHGMAGWHAAGEAIAHDR
ncbi:MAG: NAD(P)/FAD-dependent oxidoreductase [Acidimicrobiales bacterium]